MKKLTVTMNKKYIFGFVFALMSISLFSCQEDEINTFDSDVQGIYFQTGNVVYIGSSTEQYYDSAFFSFSKCRDELTDTILYVTAKTMGNVKDYDRPFTVTYDKEKTTAVEGTHFEIIESSCVIPAGASKTRVEVKIIRAKDLADKTVDVYLKLEPNEYFEVPFETQGDYNYYTYQSDEIMASEFCWSFSDIYAAPFIWSYFGEEYFGKFTVTKIKYFNKVLGLKAEDWLYYETGEDTKVRYNTLTIYASKLRRILQEAADSGNPVYDEDGQFMQLGDNYQVDYSKCI